MSSVKVKFVLIGLVFSCLVTTSFAVAGPVYVYHQPDGSKKFSNIPPPNGIKAQVFTARKSTFSWYNQPPRYGGVSMIKLYGKSYDEMIASAAAVHELDSSLIKAVIHAESGFNPKAVSPKGAQGLMQLMPGTARDMGVYNSFSPAENISGGSRYLKYLLTRYKGNEIKALAAYNAGMDWVDKYNGVPPFEETQRYVKIVSKLRDRYKAKG
jgi:soluble lytic murein transglycosylase-like protein